MRASTVGWALLAVVLLPVAWLLLRPESVPPTERQTDRQALRELHAQVEALMTTPKAPVDSDNPLLQLPEHLQHAPEAEQRAYLVELAHHARGMLDLTRQQLVKLEEQAEGDPTLQADVERTNKAIQEGERSLRGLMDHLGLPSDAG